MQAQHVVNRFPLGLLVILCLTGGLQSAWAGQGVGVSPAIKVDTTGLGVSITLHHATSEVLVNAGDSAGIDERIRVDPTNEALLAAQPQIVPYYDPVSLDENGLFGLVADGVTPIIVKISTADTLPAEGRIFEFELTQYEDNTIYSTGDMEVVGIKRIYRIEDGSFKADLKFRLTPSNRTAFFVIGPFENEQLVGSGRGAFFNLKVRKEGAWFASESLKFQIRRPPLVLIHGYNADNGTWADAVESLYNTDRSRRFVLPINYGPSVYHNTHKTLSELLPEIDSVLDNTMNPKGAMEGTYFDLRKNWAFTRYDVVAHSQGGVLLRFLCSDNPGRFQSFRSPANHYRGRFRRVITIGSPHVGSTMCEMALRIFGSIGWQSKRAWFGDLINFVDPEDLYQSKFRVGNDSELYHLNNRYSCDEDAKLHLLGTTVNCGAAPGASACFGANEHLFYESLGVDHETPTLSGRTAGEIIAPWGADGVVDVASQSATLPNSSSQNRFSFIDPTDNIAHASIGGQTSSLTVAREVLTLLNGSGDAFGPVVIAEDLVAVMELARQDIEAIAPLFIAEHGAPSEFEPFVNQTTPAIAARALAEPVTIEGDPQAAASYATDVLTFELQPPTGEEPIGAVTWLVDVYGPDGITSAGLSQVVSGTYNDNLELTVDASVLGEVVLRVIYPAVSGKKVIGAPLIVLSRAPGDVLSSVEFEPASVSMRYGPVLPLELWAVYDNGARSLLFLNSSNVTFSSSDETVATVDASRNLRLLAPGSATITATYDGAWVATQAVSSLDDVSAVTSPAEMSGRVGEAFSYQITASDTVTTFEATGLPDGLTLDPVTGLISGTPTEAGRFAIELSVTNSNGTGRTVVEFAISGIDGPPTAIGLGPDVVADGAPAGTVVGSFATADPDPLDTFSYTLAVGIGDTNNAHFSISGDELLLAAVPDMSIDPDLEVRVRSTDGAGAWVEQAFVISVVGPPTISQQPLDRTANAGDPVELSADATGRAPLDYQWRKGGVDIPGATTRFLTLDAASEADAGSYSVLVSNEDGSELSTPATLTIEPLSYDLWVTRQIPAYGQPIQSDEDYNGDGIINLFDFAFVGELGHENARSYLPKLVQTASGLEYRWSEAKNAGAATRMFSSPDLLSWDEFIPPPEAIMRVDQGNTEDVRVDISGYGPPAPDGDSFFKVDVEQGAAP